MILKKILASLLFLLIADISAAQDWVQTSGPDSTDSKTILPNGRVTCIFEDKGKILAFTGLYGSHIIGWESTDKGSNWKPTYQNFKYPVSSIVKDSSGNLLVASGPYIVKLKDSISKLITDYEINGLVVNQNGDIFAYFTYSGIYKSSDTGWVEASYGIFEYQISFLTSDKNGNLYAGGITRVFISKDNGNSWQSLAQINLTAMIFADDGSIVANESSFGMVRSRDTMKTLSDVSDGMPKSRINTLMNTPNGSVFAATDSGVYRLDSGSSAWFPFSKGLKTKKILCLAYDSQGYIYAGSDGSGIFRSMKTIDTTNLCGWIKAEDIDFGFVSTGSETCRDVYLRNAGNTLITLNKNFILKDQLPFSVDTVFTPFPVIIQPNSYATVRVCFHPPQVATYLSEINWGTDIDPSVINAMKHTSILKGKALVQTSVQYANEEYTISLHPNPATGNSITLSLSQPLSRSAEVSLFDVLGKELWKSSIIVGEKELMIPVQNLPKGMYYVRIQSGDTTITKEFIR